MGYLRPLHRHHIVRCRRRRVWLVTIGTSNRDVILKVVLCCVLFDITTRMLPLETPRSLQSPPTLSVFNNAVVFANRDGVKQQQHRHPQHSNQRKSSSWLRFMEENNDAEEENQNDGNNNNNNNREPGGNDDFFDDFIQDDYVSSSNNNNNNNYNSNNNGYYFNNGGGNNNGQHQQTYDDFYNFEKNKTPTLLPLQTSTIISFVVASLALGLGASSGTGGGGTIVPIYILIARLPIQVAIPIGAVTVFGGALASTCFNWTRRHPLADRVLIDWDLVLVMEPLVLVGALLGTLFHRLLSDKFLIVVLVLLLSITAHTTLSKAMRMYQAEIRYIRHLRASQSELPISPSSLSKTDTWGATSDNDPVTTGMVQPHPTMTPTAANTTNGISNSHHISSNNIKNGGVESSSQLDSVEKQAILILNPDFVTLRSELIQQEKFTPRGKIIALCCMFSVFIFLNIMVGGGAYKSPWDIICGSVAFWVIHVIMVAFLIASAWAAHSYVVARFEIKKLVRFDYVHGDIKWDTKSAVLYPAVFVSAGLFAGTLGIGGGSTYSLFLSRSNWKRNHLTVCMFIFFRRIKLCATAITVPMMLAMGVHPAVVSATSSAMILFTSLAATTSFFVFGLLLFDFAMVGFVVGFIAASLGQILMRQARQARSASGRDFERNSYTAFAIGGVILVSALLMTIEVRRTVVCAGDTVSLFNSLSHVPFFQYVFSIVEQPDDQGGLCDGLRF